MREKSLINSSMRNFFLVLLMGYTSLGGFAQKLPAQNGFHKENFMIGGIGGFSFGKYSIINISPELGFRINHFIEAGLGLNGQYIYLKERDNGQLYRKIQQGGLGVNFFTRVYPIGPVMLQIQPEVNYIFGKQIFYQPFRQAFRLDAILVPSLLVGGGVAIHWRCSMMCGIMLMPPMGGNPFSIWDTIIIFGRKKFTNRVGDLLVH